MAWEPATVVRIHEETPTASTFTLRLPHPSAHLAGQHYVLRLTAEDGYTASRSYSVASAPDGSTDIDLTVELLPDGEVSTFLHEEVVVGDELEVRGPIGGWFVWNADRPALLIGGGSGVVPLMAMLRLARARSFGDVRLAVSVRRPEDLYYADELPGPETTVVYTRTGDRGHLTDDDIRPLVLPDADVYICGSSRFADAATDLCVGVGVPANRIRVERFGPS